VCPYLSDVPSFTRASACSSPTQPCPPLPFLYFQIRLHLHAVTARIPVVDTDALHYNAMHTIFSVPSVQLRLLCVPLVLPLCLVRHLSLSILHAIPQFIADPLRHIWIMPPLSFQGVFPFQRRCKLLCVTNSFKQKKGPRSINDQHTAHQWQFPVATPPQPLIQNTSDLFNR